MSVVILMGAGASFGSGDATPHVPPLGKDLFQELEGAGGIAAELPENIKAIFRDDFEKGMASYYEEAQGNTMRFQRELAHYLAQFHPGPSNFYVRLLKDIGIEKVVYSSLNYDLLFESSAAMLGLNTIYENRKIRDCARLLKPHG